MDAGSGAFIWRIIYLRLGAKDCDCKMPAGLARCWQDASRTGKTCCFRLIGLWAVSNSIPAANRQVEGATQGAQENWNG